MAIHRVTFVNPTGLGSSLQLVTDHFFHLSVPLIHSRIMYMICIIMSNFRFSICKYIPHFFFFFFAFILLEVEFFGSIWTMIILNKFW